LPIRSLSSNSFGLGFRSSREILAKSANETQLERWRTAYERDRLSGADYADPAAERAVVIFVANLGMTVKRLTPAWVGPNQVNARLPLYWYVTNFPEAKVLVGSCQPQDTRASARTTYSLSLGEAAEVDGADVEPLAHLRTFFSQRQPKCTRRSHL